jgi:hypothetical protein
MLIVCFSRFSSSFSCSLTSSRYLASLSFLGDHRTAPPWYTSRCCRSGTLPFFLCFCLRLSAFCSPLFSSLRSSLVTWRWWKDSEIFCAFLCSPFFTTCSTTRLIFLQSASTSGELCGSCSSSSSGVLGVFAWNLLSTASRSIGLVGWLVGIHFTSS